MTTLSVRIIALVSVMAVATGCATSQDKMLPVEEGQTMMDVWQGHVGGSINGKGQNASSQVLLDARQSLRRDLDSLAIDYSDYTRSVANETHSQFVRLPNPDLVMYVFPHLTGSPSGEQVPIPGYSTLFPLFASPQYAMPGETKRPRQLTRSQ